jgi:Ca2+-binding RTX toxin-like protein
MPTHNLITGNDGANTINGTAGADLVYGFDPNGPQSQVSTINAKQLVTGLGLLTFATAPQTDPERLWITEKNGRILILDLATDTLKPTPFLDISATLETTGEQGVLGLAFDPGYAQNGLFYVACTNINSDVELRRYHVSANPDVADAASGEVLLTIDMPAGTRSHRAGWIGFGPDNLLYMNVGDGTQRVATADIESPLGKILRIDVSKDDFPNDPAKNYGIPQTNPFVGVAGLDEIFALGLRNPWRSSFDRGLGDLFIGDVGGATFEEINLGALGADYGWRFTEGPFDPAAFPNFTQPIHSYLHNFASGFAAVTGGYVYRGESDALQGAYFFSDFSNGTFNTLKNTGGTWTATERTAQITPNTGTIEMPASYGEDARGNLYLVDYFGEVYRLTPRVNSLDINDALRSGAGNDIVFGGAGDDLLDGGADSDTVYGGAGNDIVLGGAGDDLQWGDAGDDTFFGEPGMDQIVGGAGIDVVSYGGLVAGATVYLDRSLPNAGAAAGDRLYGIENVYGSATAGDQLFGDAGANRLTGLGGNDRLEGRAGNDTLTGGEGDDTLVGGAGLDRLVGNAGADKFVFDQKPILNQYDRVLDFDPAADEIDISASAFGGGLTAGGAVPFVSAIVPQSTGFTSGVLLYGTTTGYLSWDADGQGAGESILFAIITGPAPPTAADFVIIG